MIVCVCKGLTGGVLKQLLGNETCPSLKDVMTQTGAGSGCGKCLPELRESVKSAQRRPDCLEDKGVTTKS